ncbi:hypothetical protein KKB64_01260 [Patescibacteria group bacterium]|nr:hypothetical protein [Patescibacteria group bacterium]MBU1472403.1 hypothetical protein [Patescibacteria group bacterium]MBU2460051.1 hypothetical protein [Patescibacteria group bacterium]MBU2544781.1 hypothetical protein [Patescibacteria group bacterium]
MAVCPEAVAAQRTSGEPQNRLADDEWIAPLFFYLHPNPLAMALVERFLQAGEAVRAAEDDDTRQRASQAFEELVDQGLDGPFARILSEDHPVYQGNLLTVVRHAIGPAVGGKEELPVRQYRGVSDRSGNRG